MGEEIWYKQKGWIVVMIMVVVIIVIVAMRVNVEKPHIDQDCCQRICDNAGNGLKCHTIFNKEVSCTLSYEKYGKPEISEIFKFYIQDVDGACAVPEVKNEG